MAYDKHTWQCGETITAEKLNHIENGIASSGGMDYDLIIRKRTSENPEILKGDFAAVYEKVRNREPVFGLFINSGSYSSAVIDDQFPLLFITDLDQNGGLLMKFSKAEIQTGDHVPIYVSQWNVDWVASGITSCDFQYAAINSAP